MRKVVVLGGIVIAAVVGAMSCDNGDTCGAGTHLSGTTCVPDALDLSVPTMPGPMPGSTCGPNTMMMNNQCVITASACGPGTTLDTTSSSCQITANNGTKIWSSTMTGTWTCNYMKTSSVPDGGSPYVPIGTESQINPGVPNSTPMYLANIDPTTGALISATPMGGLTNLPVTFYTGATGNTRTAVDHQLTVGEWAACKASYEIYKDPPSGKKFYKVIVRMQGCPANLGFTVWGFYSTDGVYDNIILGFPLGGVPQFFQTNGDGTAYWEREIDPNIFFKSGVTLAGSSHGAGNGKVPSVTDYPNAAFEVDVVYHNTGQSNGNPSFCVRDSSNKCVTPPAPDIFLPGQFGIDTGPSWTGGLTTGGPSTTKPIPIGMIQPY